MVYCKLAEEGYKTSTGENTAELKLKTEIFIPLKGGSKDQPNIIGRFIGKEGQNVSVTQGCSYIVLILFSTKCLAKAFLLV